MQVAQGATTTVNSTSNISIEERNIQWKEFVTNNPEFKKATVEKTLLNPTIFVTAVRYEENGEIAVVTIVIKTGYDGTLLPKTASLEVRLPAELLSFSFDQDNPAFEIKEQNENQYSIKQKSYEKGMTCLTLQNLKSVMIVYTTGYTAYTVTDESGEKLKKEFCAAQKADGAQFRLTKRGDTVKIVELGKASCVATITYDSDS